MRFLKKSIKDPNKVFSSSGSAFKSIYNPLFDGKTLKLVESGTINWQDEINSHALECDISVILARLHNGDYSALNQNSPIFADFKNLPSNFRECFDIAFSAERIFNSLAPDIRARFDNDYRQFIYSAGSDEFNSIFNVASVSDQEESPSFVQPSSDEAQITS